MNWSNDELAKRRTVQTSFMCAPAKPVARQWSARRWSRGDDRVAAETTGSRDGPDRMPARAGGPAPAPAGTRQAITGPRTRCCVICAYRPDNCAES